MQIGREQQEVVIDDNKYIITALDATTGLDVMNQLMAMNAKGEPPSPTFIKKVMLKSSLTVNNIQMDEKIFDSHFSKKYDALFKLFAEITKFNFGEGEVDPNE